MKSITTLLLSTAMLSAVHAQPTCPSPLLIGAWNIQWLGNPAKGKRPAQKPADVASYIAAAKVDVLALAEISVTSRDANGLARNQTLDEAFALLNADGGSWQYLLFEKRAGARDPDDQWTGIAWNAKAVTKTDGPWRLDISVDPNTESELRRRIGDSGTDTVVLSRWPNAVQFAAGAGKTDFVVVPVHLKSNIGGAATADVREYEVQLLREGLAKLHAQHRDADLVVLGDSNMLSSQEPAGAELAKAQLRDCNARDLGTHLPFKRNERAAPFDRIYVTTGQPESDRSCSPEGNGKDIMDFKIVRPADWKVGTTSVQFRKLLSDHQLVRTALCVQADDD